MMLIIVIIVTICSMVKIALEENNEDKKGKGDNNVIRK